MFSTTLLQVKDMEISNEIIMEYLKVEGESHAGIATPATLQAVRPLPANSRILFLRSKP
jgi:hypothetical protein